MTDKLREMSPEKMSLSDMENEICAIVREVNDLENDQRRIMVQCDNLKIRLEKVGEEMKKRVEKLVKR